MIPRREIAWGRRWRSYGRPEGDLLEFMKSHGGPQVRLGRVGWKPVDMHAEVRENLPD
jgi:hypothetical protein